MAATALCWARLRTKPQRRRIGPAEEYTRINELLNVVRILWSVILLLLIGGSASHGDAPTREYQIKLAFLHKFVKFVTWPGEAFQSADDPLRIAVYGRDAFSGSLNSIAGKIAKGRELTVHRVETVEDLVAYHVVFIPASAEEQISTILEALDHSPTLTVGETDGFATRGGMMNFVIVKNKVRFEINMQAADRAGLKISSQLLRAGILVRDSTSERGP